MLKKRLILFCTNTVIKEKKKNISKLKKNSGTKRIRKKQNLKRKKKGRYDFPSLLKGKKITTKATRKMYIKKMKN